MHADAAAKFSCIYCCHCCCSFIAHYNAPKFYHELKVTLTIIVAHSCKFRKQLHSVSVRMKYVGLQCLQSKSHATTAAYRLQLLLISLPIICNHHYRCNAYMWCMHTCMWCCAVQDKTIKKYNKVVGVSFGASILLFIAMTAFPFLTFGANCKG
jgi:hypothetical protein